MSIAKKQIKFTTTVTHLEMWQRPQLDLNWGDAPLSLTEEVSPDLKTYQTLYDDIGRSYHWVHRRYMSDSALEHILNHPDNHVFYLRHGLEIIGFTEVNARKFPEIEIVFVGLKQQAISQGIGKKLLHHTLEHIWTRNPARVIIQTNTLDHPRALLLYQKIGFTPFKQAKVTIIDRG